jgi:2-hydroxy-3-keto-5-methylthiopentenyl-1-phosphate phosphatase
LDFYIRRFLDSQKLLDHVSLCAPRIEFTPSGLKATFPELNENGSVNFKDNQVRHYRRLGEKIIFFGNGSGDYQAAKIADYLFVIKGSVLADMCRRTKVAFHEITDFQEATETVKRLVGT